MKLLSIIIPTYNMENYLEKCVNSLINIKSKQKIEVIIVNDGSKDNSLIIGKKLEKQHPNIVKVIDKINGGHGSTINTGIDYCSGKYFKVVDADDWVLSDEFELFIQQLSFTNSDAIITHFDYVNESNNVIHKVRYEKLNYNEVYNFMDLNRENIKMVMHSLTYKTEIFKMNQIKIQENLFYVDNEYNLLPVPFINKIEFFNINLYQYLIGRANQSVSMNSRLKNYYHFIKVLERLINYLNEVDINLEQKIYLEKNLINLIQSNYYLFPYLPDKCSENIKKALEFDNLIRNIDFNLYNKSKNIYICLLRVTNFRILFIFQKIQPFWRFKVKPTLKKITLLKK